MHRRGPISGDGGVARARLVGDVAAWEMSTPLTHESYTLAVRGAV
jgi:hypothetical protein